MTSATLTKHHVPILDEHQLVDAKGSVVIRLDAAKLEEIALVNNKRIASTGDEIPLVIGHTKDNASEDEQPEIVGYASNLRVEPFFRTGKKCITATFKFFKRTLDKVRGFPRRSIELWLSDYKIDPISLLGATTPERDLGLLRLSKGGVKKYNREISDMNPQEIISGVIEGLQQTDVWQFLSQLAEQAGQEEGAPEEGMEDMPPEEGMEDMPPEGGMEEGPPEGMGEEPMDEEPMEDEQPVQAQRRKGYDNIKLSRAERQNQELQQELYTLKVRFQRSEREKDLIGLEAEGYLLDRGEELDLVSGMPAKNYKAHLAIIKKRYQKAPLSGGNFYSESRTGSMRGRTRDEVNSVIDHATTNGISYQEALSALNGTEKVI